VILEALHAAVQAARAAGAADAEASYEGGRFRFTRFANSYFTQAGVVDDPVVRVRVLTGDGRLGAAVSSSLATDALAVAARRAAEAARAAPVPTTRIAFARPDASRRPFPGRADAATAAAGADEHADLCARLFARAARDRLVLAGSLHTGPREVAVVTAAGVVAHHAFSEAAIDLIALDPSSRDASGFARFVGPALSALDPAALAEDACWRAARMRDAIDVEPGPIDVVLSPAAVAEMLEWMAMTSFSARALVDKSSMLAGRAAGSPLLDERLTIAEDPGFAHPGLITIPFDSEGTTRVAVPFVAAGRAGRTVTDLATAAQLHDDRGSTGHAPGIASDFSEGPGPAHLVMHPGADALDALVGRLDHGLLVTRFHYVNGLLDTRRATMTGMTRDGLFLVERGQIMRGVRPLRWTDSFLDALSTRLGGVGKDLAASKTSWSRLGQVLCPPLLIRQFRFTGRSR
jgi:predicted Zn-dependent protease